MDTWLLVLLILFAIMLPGLLVLRFFPYLQVVEARLQGLPSPRWQVYLASLFPLLTSLFFFLCGTATVIFATTSDFEWSVVAIAVLFYAWGARSALHLALLHSRRNPAAIVRMSQLVNGFGFVAAGIVFLVSAIREEWWFVLVGGAFLWLGVAFLYASRKANESAQTG